MTDHVEFVLAASLLSSSLSEPPASALLQAKSFLHSTQLQKPSVFEKEHATRMTEKWGQ